MYVRAPAAEALRPVRTGASGPGDDTCSQKTDSKYPSGDNGTARQATVANTDARVPPSNDSNPEGR